ncbi:hypothetical protein ANCDUO_07261 [Ancylostoma duodenale]|uniref:Uncharacterized protein n=1 Tax=Ancylostoma duodenale TaxID=51022 RepID=A0A0C2DIZ3_9BILA|nr:hypothetical protein ANCDUO_07261 [Ancylostoma duodenale]
MDPLRTQDARARTSVTNALRPLLVCQAGGRELLLFLTTKLSFPGARYKIGDVQLLEGETQLTLVPMRLPPELENKHGELSAVWPLAALGPPFVTVVRRE